jgi:ribosome-associated toxin RatA of RatAB toxin-antitoxin module
MMTTRKRRIVGMTAAMVLGSIGCASQSAPPPTWANKRDKADELPIAQQGGTDPSVDQSGEAGRLREATTIGVPIEGSDLVRGRSTVVVHAPIGKVRDAVIDFGSYSDFMPHYKAARVLRRKADGTREVYMQWAALHGAIKMWARFEMTVETDAADGNEATDELWRSKFLDGNVQDAHAIWHFKALSADRTELSLEVFLHPKLPLPASLLNEENTTGAEKGVVAMRKHIEED